MNFLRHTWFKIAQKIALTPEQAERLARVKFPCC